MERRRDRPRIADVARAAGVSKTAVSFAFNAPERLSAETAGRIRDVADSLGYRPNPLARMLTQSETMTLGVLTPQPLGVMFANPFFAQFSEGVADAAAELGYELHFISPLHGSLGRAMGRTTVDGVVAIGLAAAHPEVGQIEAVGLPMVLVDSDDLAGHSSVAVDDEAGARAAAEHLVTLGHRDILVLAVDSPATATAGPRARGVMDRRLAAYRSALARAGVVLGKDRVVAGPATIDGGAAAFRDAWAAGARPTAVLAMSDAMAIGAMRAARQHRLHIPEDLSVVGFDDIDLAADLDPALTTVHQPIREKGATAVRLLVRAISDGGGSKRVTLETHLVVRASTAAPTRTGDVPS